jgi:hypothetical protein
MDSKIAPQRQPAEQKSGVEVHWQSTVGTINDATSHLCLSAFGADVFFKPVVKDGVVVDRPKVYYSNICGSREYPK